MVFELRALSLQEFEFGVEVDVGFVKRILLCGQLFMQSLESFLFQRLAFREPSFQLDHPSLHLLRLFLLLSHSGAALVGLLLQAGVSLPQLVELPRALRLELAVFVRKALQLALEVFLVGSKLPQLPLKSQLFVVDLLDH